MEAGPCKLMNYSDTTYNYLITKTTKLFNYQLMSVEKVSTEIRTWIVSRQYKRSTR